MAPFTTALKTLRRRRFIALAAAVGILFQGLMPIAAAARMPTGDSAELFAGKIAICSPSGVTYVDVEPGQPAPARSSNGGCVKCCPFANDALSSSVSLPGSVGWFGVEPFLASGEGAVESAPVLGPQAPRAPPAS